MKLKITFSKECHRDTVTCINWRTTEEVFSCGDDNQVLKWNITTNECSQFAELSKDMFAIDMQWFPRTSSLNKHNEMLLLICSDGKFHFINRSGRIEKSVEAHKGAVLVGVWSPDGVALLTGGEDGVVKIWSRGGMLRSTVASEESPVYSAAWAPDSQSVLYTQERGVILKSLVPNTKPIKWRAHDGLILCSAWSHNADLIVTGSEDCRYKVWEPSTGKLLFASGNHDYPITSLAWTPHGDLFAVGTYNTLRLCHASGWSECLEKPDTGTIYNMRWSSDGTQLAAACATGQVVFAHLIQRQFEWQNYVVNVIDKKSIVVRDILTEVQENLDFSENIIKVAIGYGHLVVTTTIQCHVYSTSNWNTPTIFDLKDGIINHILLAEKCFVTVEGTSVTVYTYQGRIFATPRWPSMNPERLSLSHISLASDTLCILDQTDYKTLHVLDLSVGRSSQDSLNSFKHCVTVRHVAVSQCTQSSHRLLAILDTNKDLFITSVRTNYRIFSKIGGQIEFCLWHSDHNMISVVQDTAHLTVWYCPIAATFSNQLLKLTSSHYDCAQLGKAPRLTHFTDNTLVIRRSDGSLLNTLVSPYPALLHEHVSFGRWTEALNLCRLVQEPMVWACLATLATQEKSLESFDTAEEAYGAIGHFDKVTYIQHIKSATGKKTEQTANAALLAGCQQEAETTLLQNGLIEQAVEMNMLMHQWNRALDIAMKHRPQLTDTVLQLRQQYLSILSKTETNQQFLQFKEKLLPNEVTS